MPRADQFRRHADAGESSAVGRPRRERVRGVRVGQTSERAFRGGLGDEQVDGPVEIPGVVAAGRERDGQSPILAQLERHGCVGSRPFARLDIERNAVTVGRPRDTSGFVHAGRDGAWRCRTVDGHDEHPRRSVGNPAFVVESRDEPFDPARRHVLLFALLAGSAVTLRVGIARDEGELRGVG